MGILNAKPREKREYYNRQADQLSRQADKVRNETDNIVEANRLEKAASDAKDAANSIDESLEDVADKIR